MNDITRHLREADPARREPGPTPDAIAELRRVVVTAAQDSSRAPVAWRRRMFAIAAAVALIVGAGMVANRRAPSTVADTHARPAGAPAAGERTQVQFSTPGGTRIVWTIDPSFHIKGNR
jgi:hypothetical protein